MLVLSQIKDQIEGKITGACTYELQILEETLWALSQDVCRSIYTINILFFYRSLIFSQALLPVSHLLLYFISLRMQMIGRINSQLEKGWKMTDVYCPNCNGTTMAEPKPQIDSLYCPKEDKTFPYDFERLEQEPQEHQRSKSSEEDEYFENVVQQRKKEKAQNPPINNKPSDRPHDFDMIELNEKDIHALGRTNDVSKKIGEKLLQGWTMLDQSCNNCYAPIMRSKNGLKVCFGCESADKKPAKEKDVPPTVIKPVTEQLEIDPQRQKSIVKGQSAKPKRPKTERLKKQQDKKEPMKQEKQAQEKEEKEEEEKEEKESEKEGEHQLSEKVIINQNIQSLNREAISRIEKRALQLLYCRLQRAFKFGNIEEVQRSLQLVYKIKHQFR